MKVRLVNLSRAFRSARGYVRALDRVFIDIQDGEYFVLLGPSGCGKSTLLNLVAGLDRPTAGEVWFGDRLVSSREQGVFTGPRERNVAMVFQSYALYPHLTAFENIAFPLRVGRERNDKIQQAVSRVARMLEIEEVLTARPVELSGGQRQRVAIARAVVREPNVLLLDEPLSNLDAQLRVRARFELKALQRRLATTTIYVTHDQVEAMALGDRIAVLNEGRIEQVGTPHELYHQPVNTFVATFIGSPPMNLLRGTLGTDNGKYCLMLEGSVKVALPEDKVRGLGVKPGEGCIYGIRPEDIVVSGKETSIDQTHQGEDRHQVRAPDTTLKVRIEAVEPVGKEVLLRFELGGQAVAALTEDEGYKAGETVTIQFDWGWGHLFAW